MTIDFAQYAILITFLGLASLIGAVAGVSTILKNISMIRSAENPARMPPMAEDLAKNYATKADLQGFKCEWQTACRSNHERVDKTFGEVFNVLRAQQAEIIDKLDGVKEWQFGIERQIGKIEGGIKK